ncbi:MAG TPA: cytochrome P450 [Candidatus Competibacteraceae bacterium]|nr:cytochrome P450 [Candidatus Competibacteraceae bacterium]
MTFPIATLRRGTGTGSSCPPGPKGHFLFGNLPDFGRAPLDFLIHCRRDYGAIVGLRIVHRPVYLLNCPELVDEVLVRQSQNFIKSTLFYRHLTAIFGQGLLTSEGEFWRRQRRLIAPAFHSERIAGYSELMVRYTERMLQDWQAGELRNVHQDMMDLTMRIVAKTLFAAEIGAGVAEISRTFTAVVEEISARLIRPFAVPAYLPTPGNRRYSKGIKQLNRLVYRLIREHRQHGEDRGDLLSLLLAAQDEDGRALTDRQLRDELVTLFLGGHETTAVTLSWTWYLLARHPAVVDRLIIELREVLGGRSPTIADLDRLVYTEGIIKEVMRLYPPAWAIAREAVSPFKLGGYWLPAGATVAISPWVLHRDSCYFKRPEAFLPERWQEELSQCLPRQAFMPFGGGPRICIGHRFAMVEAVLILATIAQQFHLDWQAEYPVTLLPSITLRPEGGVWVKVLPR